MKADIMLEQELVPLKKQIRIIDESFELIKTASEQKKLLQQEVEQLEKQAQELQDYREQKIAEGKTLPQGLMRLNEIIIQNVDSELDDNKSDLAIKRRSLTLISNKLQKKLEFTLGKDFTSEQEQSYFELLKKQKARLNQEITVVLGKKQVLVRILQAQYQAEKIGKLHSVPKLTKDLVEKILED